MKPLSFTAKQKAKGKRVADFALTLAEGVLRARLLCMEAAQQLHKQEKPLTKRRRNETTRPKKRSV